MTYREIECLPIDQVRTDAIKPQIGWIKIADLRIDTRYQRDIERRGLKNIEAIARDFRWSRFTPVLCAPMVDGNFAVIDGQHRTHAALACGFTKVPALIVPMSEREQAEAFAWVNGAVTAITPIQIYKSALAAGLDWAIACDRVVADAGCRLMTSNASAPQKKAGQVFCVGLVKNLVAAGKGHVVTKVLRAIQAAGYCDPYFYSAAILDPLCATVWDHKHLSAAELTQFLMANEITDIQRAVNRLRDQPAYFRQPFRKLFIASLRARWREFTGQIPPVTNIQKIGAAGATS